MSVRTEARRPSNAWIVVADRAAARLFSAEWPDLSGFREIESLVHPQGALHGRDVYPDRFGRNHAPDSHGYTDAPPTDLRHFTAREFAHQIAERLERGRTHGEFGRVVVIAPPLLLGELRDQYSAPLRKLLEAELDKELVMSTDAEICDQVRRALPRAAAPSV
jgi:protein required for attachment to host cells